jgi:hypothetical protein
MNTKPDPDIPVRDGYADISNEELPSGDDVRAFLKDTKHAKFKVQTDIHDLAGNIVELELTSGFRVPILAEQSDGPAKEVVKTIRGLDESMLVEGQPNAADLQLAQNITYSSEIYEFLLFSLSKDIQTGPDGAILDPTYEVLRNSIVNRGAALYKELTKCSKPKRMKTQPRLPLSS